MFSLAIEAGKLHHKPHVATLREDDVRVGFFEREQYEAVLARLPEGMRPVGPSRTSTDPHRVGANIVGEIRVDDARSAHRVLVLASEIVQWSIGSHVLAGVGQKPHPLPLTLRRDGVDASAWLRGCRRR
jgi:hypothetical protein